MATPLPDEYVRRGFDAEAARHQHEAIRALELAQQHLTAALASVRAGRPDTYALRQMAADAVDAATRGFALAAVVEVATFARPEEG